jgi:poly(3-hydroxybutyrate) depolymerase
VKKIKRGKSMENKIKLLAGIPDDDNRAYLPETLKESEIVVNENGNNSQVYPKKLKEMKAKLIDGKEDTWYEYVPDTYDPTKKTPLVFSMHGGIMTGWAQCVYTSWSLVADREGFIVVYPNAHLRRFWQIECERKLFDLLSEPNEEGIYMHDFPEDTRENNDARMVLKLLEIMKEKYNIDEERIYMQGMSLGNSMTLLMARHFGNCFAGMAGSAGPSTIGLLFDEQDNPKNDAGPLTTWQARMEFDQAPPGSKDSVEDVVAKNREYWLRINECNELPKIKLDGENNFAFYSGKKADYVFRDVKNRDHGQTFDEAELVWDYLFSGSKRKTDGTIEYLESNQRREGDKVSFAIADNCEYAWVNNERIKMPAKSLQWQKLKYHGLQGGSIIRGEYTMIPASFLAEIQKASYNEKDGWAEMVMEDGKTLQFARGCIGCTIDNRVRAMLCEPIERGGRLYISIEWFLKDILNWQVSTYKDVLYATDHYSLLSVNMARLMKDLLK